jgi:uncharacterized protein YceK
MARPVVPAILPGMLALALVGCGTVRNLGSEKPVPYGGVSSDVKLCGTALEGNVGVHGCPPLLGMTILTGAFCCGVVDAPLSLVGDTLSLPYLVASEFKRGMAESDRPPPPEEAMKMKRYWMVSDEVETE